MRQYASYLDALRFMDIRASNGELTIRDRHNLLGNTDVGTWVKGWLHCGGRDMSMWRCVSSEDDSPFVWCYKKVEYGKDLYTPVRRLDGQLVLETGPLFVVLRCPSSHLYFAKRFDYWARDCDFELHLRRQARGIFIGLQNVKLFSILQWHGLSHYVGTSV